MFKNRKDKSKNIQENATQKILTESDVEKFTQRGFSQKKFHTGALKFKRLYNPKFRYSRYVIAAVIGIVMSFFSVLLVQSTGLYTGGFGAICQGIARLVYASLNINEVSSNETRLIIYNVLFWGLYLAINIPLIVFAYFKINKQFAILSVVYLVSMQGMGFVWGVIPQIADFKIFGLTNSIYPQLDNMKVQVNIFAPTWYPTILDNNNWVVDWDKLVKFKELVNTSGFDTHWNQIRDTTDGRAEWIQNLVENSNITNAFLLFLYCFGYSLISSLGYALVYILGGSTGGSDFITIYLSQEKNKNVGLMFIIVNAICMIIGITIGSYGAGVLIDSIHFSGAEFFFSANLFVSLLFIILNGVLMNKWFPWHKMTKIEIYSTKKQDVINELKAIGYTHPITIIEGTGGISGMKRDVLVTICMIVELPSVVRYVRLVDQDCLISSTPINDLDGNFTIQRQTF